METSERDLLLKEAEWVWSEMEDFVRQIQRYRLTYATALFVSIGWILGQLVEPSRATVTLASIRGNTSNSWCHPTGANARPFALLIRSA